jgi:hypothetical protein
MLSQTVIAQIKTLKAALGNLQTIPFSKADELLEIIDRAPEEALIEMVRERIKFLWMPASRRLREDFKWSADRVQALQNERKLVQELAEDLKIENQIAFNGPG